MGSCECVEDKQLFTERWKLRRQMASAVKKEPVSLCLFMKVNIHEVAEDLSTMAPVFWAEGVWMGQTVKRAAEGVEEADLQSRNMDTGERTCRSSHVRDSSLGHPVARSGTLLL